MGGAVVAQVMARGGDLADHLRVPVNPEAD
jgi:hypothetical protein